MDRDGGVGLDELGHHASQGLDTERKRSDVEQKDILHVACKHAALDGRSDGNDLVRIDALVRLLAEEVLHEFLHLRDTGRTAHEQNLIDVGSTQMRIRKGLAARLDGPLEEVVAESLELGAGEGLDKVLRHTVHGRDVRQVDFCAGGVGEFDLRLLGRFLEPLESHRVLLEVDAAVVGGELAGEPLDDGLVEIVASEVGVAVGGLHFEDSVAEFEDGDIESTAAEVIDRDFHILVLLVQTVGEGGCRRLVDDSLHLKSGYLAGLLGGLTLRV